MNICLKSKHIVSTLIGFALFIFSNLSQAMELPQQDNVPGGIAIIQLNETGDIAPRVSYNKKSVMVIKHQQTWHALIGIPLAAKNGEHSISSEHAGTNHNYTFLVSNKQYETQHLTIKNKRKVNPNPDDMKRIGKEKKQINAALAHWDDNLYTDTLLLDLPVVGRLSSPFGLRRFFNEQPRKPHSGIDIAAPKGTPINAPASGKVILTGDFFFNGNSAFIDHGQGLITMYCHMDSIKVKEGQLLKQGEQIGTIGMTGRVTGPHLHWSISMNNARIDPNLIVPALRQSAQANTTTPTM